MLYKITSILIITTFALLPMGLAEADAEMGMFSCHSEETFGVHVNSETPGYASIYIYGPTNANTTLDPYGKESVGPLDAGTYSVIMYSNYPGSHKYKFNGKTDINSDGWASFNVGGLPTDYYCNSSADVEYLD